MRVIKKRPTVDLAFRTVENAVKCGGQSASLLAADIRRLPFRSSSVDLILSNSTLDHFESGRPQPRQARGRTRED